jgi:hypothetical protein
MKNRGKDGYDYSECRDQDVSSMMLSSSAQNLIYSKVETGVGCNYFIFLLSLPRLKLETTQKLKLMGKDGQFTHTSTTPSKILFNT